MALIANDSCVKTYSCNHVELGVSSQNCRVGFPGIYLS